jgi:hypothetical protein
MQPIVAVGRADGCGWAERTDKREAGQGPMMADAELDVDRPRPALSAELELEEMALGKTPNLTGRGQCLRPLEAGQRLALGLLAAIWAK